MQCPRIKLYVWCLSKLTKEITSATKRFKTRKRNLFLLMGKTDRNEMHQNTETKEELNLDYVPILQIY